MAKKIDKTDMTTVKKFPMNTKLLSKPKRVETGTAAEAVEGTEVKKTKSKKK